MARRNRRRNRRTRSGPGTISIFMHVVLTIITGGFWLVVLLIRALLK